MINIILKRGYDGAVTQVRYSTAAGGQNRYQASQLWGRTWDGGDITLSYEWYDESPIKGNAHSNLTVDFTPWGLNNRTPLASAMPGIISRGGSGFPALNHRHPRRDGRLAWQRHLFANSASATARPETSARCAATASPFRRAAAWRSILR